MSPNPETDSPKGDVTTSSVDPGEKTLETEPAMEETKEPPKTPLCLSKEETDRLIQQAFASGDVNLSILAHKQRVEKGMTTEGGHNKREREFSTHIITGGACGALVSLALVGAAYGARVSAEAVLALGVACVASLSVGMGLTHTLLIREEVAHYRRERKREEWELANAPSMERREMIELYTNQGMGKDDATLVIDTLMRHRAFFVDHMMVWELGLMPVDTDYSTRKGLAALVSLLLSGLLPLLPYVRLTLLTECLAPFGDGRGELGASAVLGAVALATLGLIKARMNEGAGLGHSVGWMLFKGGLVLGIALGCGRLYRADALA